jgi:hypothetical protein
MTKLGIIVLSTILLLVSPTSKLMSQSSNERTAFVSIHTGSYIPLDLSFRRTYGKLIFINGLSLGIPFTNHDLYLYSKAMYYKKQGIPIIYHFEDNSGVPIYFTTQEGSITINHFQFNVGLQYNIIVHRNLKLITNGGLTLIKSSEESNDPLDYKSDTKGLTGFFIGAGLDKTFAGPIGIFGECQYNHQLSLIKDYASDYSAMNINFGLRYYFNQKRNN